jgi:hypothetical protein
MVQISPKNGDWNLRSLLVDPSWSTYCIVKVLIPQKREFFRGLLGKYPDSARQITLKDDQRKGLCAISWRLCAI